MDAIFLSNFLDLARRFWNQYWKKNMFRIKAVKINTKKTIQFGISKNFIIQPSTNVITNIKNGIETREHQYFVTHWVR